MSQKIEILKCDTYIVMDDEIIIDNYPTYAITKSGLIHDLRTGRIHDGHNQFGYRAVNLKNPEGQKTFLIHRLVAKAFIPNPENFTEVDHINRNKSDNRFENLRWANDFQQSQNRAIPLTNTTGHKFVTREGNGFRVQIMRNKVKITQRRFATLEEAVAHKIEICRINQISD